jgi:hypothetical protein
MARCPLKLKGAALKVQWHFDSTPPHDGCQSRGQVKAHIIKKANGKLQKAKGKRQETRGKN